MSDDKKPREWTAIFSDFQDLSSGIIQDEPWLGGSNMTSTFKVMEKIYYQKAIDENQELKANLELAVDALEKAIPEFQWVTNGLKMNEVQHIRLGDAIVVLHDALAKIKGEK